MSTLSSTQPLQAANNSLVLAWRMIRPRAVAILCIHFVLGFSLAAGVYFSAVRFVAGLVAVICSYTVGTCINDLRDYEIDKINHPGRDGRPLANNKVTSKQLYALATIAGTAAIIFSYSLGYLGLSITVAGIAIALAYSLPPFRLAYRPHLVPFALAIGCVVVPEGLGLVATGHHINDSQWVIIPAVSCLFAGKSCLKDLRDRAGDNAVGKSTLLSLYGKSAVISFAQIGLVLGCGLIIFFAHVPAVSKVGATLLIALSLLCLNSLRSAIGHGPEQIDVSLVNRFVNEALILLAVTYSIHFVTPASVGLISVLVVTLVGTGLLAMSSKDRVTVAYRG